MKAFANLICELDQTTKTHGKVDALISYFASPEVSDNDKLWALALLSGRRPRQQVRPSLLREWVSEESKLPVWIIDESYDVVGDLAETLSLLLSESKESEDARSLSEWMARLSTLGKETDATKKEVILEAWKQFNQQERFVFNKLITGGFRIGVSQSLVVRALASIHKLETAEVTHRIMGNWTPDSVTYQGLFGSELTAESGYSRPYPFYLASPVEGDVEELGDLIDWQVEWKWDGIRAQVIKRGGEISVWSRGEDLITDRFPEFASLLETLPNGSVLDGEVLAGKENEVLPFSVLQTRIGRKNLSKKALEDAPIQFFTYDYLEENGEDIRALPLSERREKLESLVESINIPKFIRTSPIVHAPSWNELKKMRTTSRERNAEGLMLKRRSSSYQVGRKRGDWWKWKIEPYSIDAVLVYAQPGHGRRADLFTDYTFAVWNEGKLVPFAKAYSGLTDQEILEVNNYVKRNTLEKFGPVRHVTPMHVFEIGFDDLQVSKRHKSGVAVRFPRILRWRKDKKIEEADTLERLAALKNVAL